jgi:hypothetical protein
LGGVDMAFVVIGTWASSRDEKICHQEVIKDDSLKPKYDAIHAMFYTDGTALYISTYPLLEPPQKLGYKDLLDAAVRQGKTGSFSVLDVKL